MFKLAITAGNWLTRRSLNVTSAGKIDTETETRRPSPGCLMAIGGAEDRTNGCELLQVFAELCGGTSARIVLITTASSMPARAFAIYAAAFRRLGICDIRELRLASHEQADGEQALTVLARATGVFFTGGDQARLEFLAGSGTNLALRGRVAADSLVVAGTSAGAAALGPVMILGGSVCSNDHNRDDQETTDDRLRTGRGLGLLPGAIIDMHFTQRRRLPRLLAAVARHPSHLGIGIDEDTAVLARSGRLHVLGRGEVVTVDKGLLPVAGSRTGPAASLVLAVPGEPAPDTQLHRLRANDAFDLEHRHPYR